MEKVWRYTKAAFGIACLWLMPIVLSWISWAVIESWVHWEPLLLSPGDWGWFSRVGFGLWSVGWTIVLFVGIFTTWEEYKEEIKNRGF